MATHNPAPEAPAALAYFKPSEVATRLNIGLRTVYELIAAGVLTPVRTGSRNGTIRITADELARYERQIRAEAGLADDAG